MKKILMKNIITKIKNSLDELSSRMKMTEQRVYELKDRSIEMIRS